MKVRFQADANLHEAIVRIIVRREPGIDFQTAYAAGLVGLGDLQVLALAAREERVLITHDQSTMPSHFSTFITAETSAGLLVVPQYLSLSVAVEELILIWVASEAEEWVNRISYIPL